MEEKLVEIDDEVREVLESSECVETTLILPDQLDRKLYVKVDKVLKALGGRWNRGLGKHVFNEDSAALIAGALARGGAVDKKRTFEAFDTPPELAAWLVELAGVRPGDSALEPSAGRGAIVQALRDAGARVRALEIDPKAYKSLQVRFQSPSQFFDVHYDDFLNYDDGGDWQRIVMNPPFRNGQAIRHVEHAMGLGSTTGTIVAVMPAGVKTNSDKRSVHFRKTVELCNGEFIDLPDDSFKTSGTRVRTVALLLTGRDAR